MMTVANCDTCSGHGTIVSDPCRTCRGLGAVPGERKVTIEIPPGVASGTRLRLSGRGEYPGRRGTAGDLHVEIRTLPHPDFEREGDDLIYRLRVGMAEAALGAKLEIPLLEGGSEPHEIHPGTQPGSVFRLPGLGTAHLGKRGRGDLLVQVVVEVPTSLSDEEEEVLRMYARLRAENPVKGKRRRSR
jgi:molecular chaperone DnaJ